MVVAGSCNAIKTTASCVYLRKLGVETIVPFVAIMLNYLVLWQLIWQLIWNTVLYMFTRVNLGSFIGEAAFNGVCAFLTWWKNVFCL